MPAGAIQGRLVDFGCRDLSEVSILRNALDGWRGTAAGTQACGGVVNSG